MRILSAITILVILFFSVATQAQTVIYSTPVATPIYYETINPVQSVSAPATHTTYCGLFARRRQAFAPQPAYYAPPQPVTLQPIAAASAPGVVYGDPCGCGPVQGGILPAPVAAGVPQTGYQSPVVLGQNPSNHYIGRGIVGQPKLYVSGQPIRNALRFLTF